LRQKVLRGQASPEEIRLYERQLLSARDQTSPN
jgi:hypothetical protein